jgi:hypothetical protein
MAKKKSKKSAQKQTEDTSAPETPKPAPATVVEDVVPDTAEPEPPTLEAQSVESTPADQIDTTAEVPDAKIDEPVQEPISEQTPQDLTDPEALSYEEPNGAEADVIKDEEATVSIEEPAEEVEAASTKDTVNDLSPTDGHEDPAADTLTVPVEQSDESASKLVDEDKAQVKHDTITESTAKDDTEATSAPVDEPLASVEEPTASVEEPLPEAEQNPADTQQDAEITEATHNDASNGHMDANVAATSELSPVSREPLEEPQSTIEAVAEPPPETAQPEPTREIATEPQEFTLDDDWAPISKKGKKTKKDKKKKQDSATGAIDKPKLASAPEPLKADIVADEVAEKRTGRHDASGCVHYQDR